MVLLSTGSGIRGRDGENAMTYSLDRIEEILSVESAALPATDDWTRSATAAPTS